MMTTFAPSATFGELPVLGNLPVFAVNRAVPTPLLLGEAAERVDVAWRTLRAAAGCMPDCDETAQVWCALHALEPVIALLEQAIGRFSAAGVYEPFKDDDGEARA